MPMDVLHGNTVPGVLPAVTVLALVYHLGRLVMGHSATRHHLGVARISVLDALRWLSGPSTGIPGGAWIVNPIRPPRVAPRVKKRRLPRVPLMRKSRQDLRQQWVQHELRG
jgi:hypothetical protein